MSAREGRGQNRKPAGLPAKRGGAGTPARRGSARPPATVTSQQATGEAEDTSRRWSAKGPVTAGLLGLLLLVGGFGGWAALSEITGAVIASGRIEVERNRQVVQHPDGGVVEEVLVTEGDTVAAGDLLIRLEGEALRSELAVVEGQLLEVLARRGRLEAERDDADEIVFPALLLETENPVAAELMEGQRRLFEARQESEAQQGEQLARQSEQIGNQIEGFESQQQAIATQLDLLEDERSDQQSLLDRGLAQAARVSALQREAANLSGTAGELTASAAEARSRITEIEIQRLRLGSERREQAISMLRDLQFNEIELSERRRTLMSQIERLDIRAPVAGAVYGLQVFGSQSVVSPAEPVLYIVPQDRPLVITAQVAPTDIDQIRVDQVVSLRFSAFDQRTTPELFGHVTQISADAFTEEGSRVSYYRAEIALDEGQIERMPESFTLIPGMPVEAFLRTDSRSPLAYLIKPFTDYFAKAFRET
ncbi:HlyD family type I secretion periplasmic adaptor subunit [Pseudoroseicyclus aestuarii]|uniref:Membrane fusion protein (MFP) family protein n=1 Tax=Pseudoroseicyclus aestuarii TaxID=1795041 RepID=A0A318SPA7_9RHOB|nr:HlyD family type I secretion periplasmic adaptor subunit [Pseudoroseicyclus aestuarii]PYE83711.1 HlyD family secretion protein [Pseudoroseicyclus aestuarii]